MTFRLAQSHRRSQLVPPPCLLEEMKASISRLFLPTICFSSPQYYQSYVFFLSRPSPSFISLSDRLVYCLYLPSICHSQW